MSCGTKRKRTPLTLAERVKVIERNKAGESMKKIADSLGVGKTQIQSIIKNTQTILDSWENGDNSERKTTKKRKCTYAIINENVWEWFCETRARNIPITGKVIQVINFEL